MGKRIVLVTGSTGVVGTAVVERFRAAGDVVLGVARSGEIAADLTTREGAALSVAEALKRHGRIDVLVHVMGGFAGGHPVEETTDEVWRRMFAMNVDSAFLVLSEVVPVMRKQKSGRIVAVGSLAVTSPASGLSAYNASKLALIALVQTVAKETEDLDITANIVLPETIDTPENRKWGTPEQIKTWVQPAKIADKIYSLCEPEYGGSGHALPVYGMERR